jgi:hypothetical protein
VGITRPPQGPPGGPFFDHDTLRVRDRLLHVSGSQPYPEIAVEKRRVFVGGGLDQPYREMNSSGPDVDRFLPEQ